MLAPAKTKFRKQQKLRLRGTATRGNDVEFGDFGLVATANGWITARQIEACRVAINRKIRKFGRMWIRIFPDKPISKKPLETRMGKGKGNPEIWVAPIRRGRMLFEVEAADQMAVEALTLASRKLPITTKVIKRGVVVS
jgi:large subunit ribosomal protein L16